MRYPRFAQVLTAMLLIALGGPRALAQDSGDEPSDLVRIAARARAIGDVAAALQALKQAMRSGGGEALALDIAELHRERFLAFRHSYDHQQALQYYQQYLDQNSRKDSSRDRVERDFKGLEGLVVIRDEKAEVVAAKRERSASRVFVEADVLDATVRVDDGPSRPVPVFMMLAPGRHQLVVEAPERKPQKHTVIAQKGSLATISASLPSLPARLKVDADEDSAVYVDDHFVGVAPMEGPIDVDPGQRHIIVGRNGHKRYEADVRTVRGLTQFHHVELDTTKQRTGALVLIGAGAVGISSGIVFGVVSVIALRRDENSAESRATFRNFGVASGFSAGVGLGLSAAGALMFTFDEPDLPSEDKPNFQAIVITPAVAGNPGLSIGARF